MDFHQIGAFGPLQTEYSYPTSLHPTVSSHLAWVFCPFDRCLEYQPTLDQSVQLITGLGGLAGAEVSDCFGHSASLGIGSGFVACVFRLGESPRRAVSTSLSAGTVCSGSY